MFKNKLNRDLAKFNFIEHKTGKYNNKQKTKSTGVSRVTGPRGRLSIFVQKFAGAIPSEGGRSRRRTYAQILKAVRYHFYSKPKNT